MEYERGYQDALRDVETEINERIGILANLDLAWLARYELRKLREELDGWATLHTIETTRRELPRGPNYGGIAGDEQRPVTISLPKSMISKIDRARGRMKRSPFLRGLLIQALGGVDE